MSQAIGTSTENHGTLEPAAALRYAHQNMKKILRSAVSATVGAIALCACDLAAPPPTTVSGPVEPEAIPSGGTLADVVREALIEIFRDADDYSRARRLGALLPTLGPELVPTVVELLTDRTLDFGPTELDLLVHYWATHEGSEATHWSAQRSPPDYRSAALFSALKAWAATDPQTAVKVAWKWSVDTDFERIVPSALVRGWFAAGDTTDIVQWIHDIPIGIPRQRAIAAYARVLIQTQGPTAATSWAESLPDDDVPFKLAAFRRVVDALSEFDHEASLRWCEAHCDGPYGNNMRSLIARSWVVRDGPPALAWLSTLPKNHENKLAVRLTFVRWAETDREAALEWMKAQTTGEPDPWLEPIYPVYAKALARDAPTEAIKWAERVEDDRQREHLLTYIALVWSRRDEPAVEEWLLESSLSEEARERVRVKMRSAI